MAIGVNAKNFYLAYWRYLPSLKLPSAKLPVARAVIVNNKSTLVLISPGVFPPKLFASVSREIYGFGFLPLASHPLSFNGKLNSPKGSRWDRLVLAAERSY